MNIEGTAFQYCGTFAHREELSKNTRGTAGMLMSSQECSGSKMNIEETAFQYCGTLAHREELSENTRGTAGMLMSSSGVQRKQDEHRRNSVPVLRNTRSQTTTVREHSRNGWNAYEQFRSAAEAR